MAPAAQSLAGRRRARQLDVTSGVKIPKSALRSQKGSRRRPQGSDTEPHKTSKSPRPGTTVTGGGGDNRLTFGLYVVATPIGNARDITLRALDVLRQTDIVACEDTRRTGKLLALHDVRARMMAYNDHNAARVLPTLVRALGDGQTVALTSDAGTPLISDPGYRLVVAAIEADIPVFTIPGPSAVTAALTVAGLPTDRFYFAGFLPTRSPARRRALSELVAMRATLVFFESPHRVAASLADMADILGHRPAAVARELTKLYETVVRQPLADLARTFQQTPARGEVAIVVAGANQSAKPVAQDQDIDARLHAALATMSTTAAAATVARSLGLPRRVVYRRALALKREDP